MPKPRNKKSRGVSKKRKLNEIPPTSLIDLSDASTSTERDISDEALVEVNLQMEQLEGKMFDMEILIDQQMKQIKNLNDSNQDIINDLRQERSRNQILSNSLNDLEQYSRRNNIRIFGIKDSRNETLQQTEYIVRELLRSKLGLNFGPSEFDICHRIGKFSTDADRAIIVRFIYRKSKIITMANRKKLARSGISIVEDLTPKNVKRLQDIKTLPCVQQSWSKDGRLFAKDYRNQIKEIKSKDEISENLFLAKPSTIAHQQSPHQTDREDRASSSASSLKSRENASETDVIKIQETSEKNKSNINNKESKKDIKKNNNTRDKHRDSNKESTCDNASKSHTESKISSTSQNRAPTNSSPPGNATVTVNADVTSQQLSNTALRPVDHSTPTNHKPIHQKESVEG